MWLQVCPLQLTSQSLLCSFSNCGFPASVLLHPAASPSVSPATTFPSPTGAVPCCLPRASQGHHCRLLAGCSWVHPRAAARSPQASSSTHPRARRAAAARQLAVSSAAAGRWAARQDLHSAWRPQQQHGVGRRGAGWFGVQQVRAAAAGVAVWDGCRRSGACR